MQTYGTIVREARLARGYTTRKFAGIMRISQSYLFKIEKNITVPTKEFTAKLEQMLILPQGTLLPYRGLDLELADAIRTRPEIAVRIRKELGL